MKSHFRIHLTGHPTDPRNEISFVDESGEEHRLFGIIRLSVKAGAREKPILAFESYVDELDLVLDGHFGAAVRCDASGEPVVVSGLVQSMADLNELARMAQKMEAADA